MGRGRLSEQKIDMERRHGVRWILLGSLCVHLLLLAALLGFFYRTPEVVITPASPEEPQFVALLDTSELPEDLLLPDLPEAPEERPKDLSSKEKVLAFQSISSLQAEPSPSPTPSATASPTVLPTATPSPLPTPSPTPRRPRTPMPKFKWTPNPRPTLRETPKPAIRLEPYELPKRDSVLGATPVIVRQTPTEQGGSRGRGGQQHFLGSRSSIVLDQEKEFPFPDYLLHLEEKIAGLWFPQGAGAVTIYLEIGRNGKILKSEVDKGTEVGVKKLQESVARALSLIKHFEALPWEYPGMTLRVRIIVRR